MIDFHTHVLPDIDDGSRNLEESIEILRQQKAQGIKKVIATSHFYPDDPINAFIERRSLAMETLKEAAKVEALETVELYTGAEVLISVDTWKLERLPELCIEGTNYLLIELPYSHWSDWVYTSVEAIIDNRKLRPIIAHVERYDAVSQNPNNLLKFIEMGALLQVNAYSLTKDSSKEKLTHKLMKHNMIHLLGSDVHRANHFVSVPSVCEMLAKKYKQEVVDEIHQVGESVLDGSRIELKETKPFKKFLGKWY